MDHHHHHHHSNNYSAHHPLITPSEDNNSSHLQEQHYGDDIRADQSSYCRGIGGGEWVKSIVYAGLDAIVTCFSLIASISGGHLSSIDVLVLGFANLVADGISMGFGDFLSTSTEKDMAANERKAADREVANDCGLQLEQLLHKYYSLGMDYEDAHAVVKVLSKYRDILVEEKLWSEKRMVAPKDEDEKPWKNGIVTFVAFIIFGCAPLLSFIVLIPFTESESVKFSGACVLSALALVLLGIAKAKIAGQNTLVSMAVTLLNGVVAASSAYAIGWALRHVAGLQD